MIPVKAQELIDKLELLPHPEGGWYKEVYRSSENLENKDRQLLTSIYFLITGENVSRFHRIQSDELWYFHQGSTLVVHTLSEENGHLAIKLGNDLKKGENPFAIVPARTVFGSCLESSNGYALVSCAVAPGFDFRDFEMMDKDELMANYPSAKTVIDQLT